MSISQPLNPPAIGSSPHHAVGPELKALLKHTSVYGAGNLLNKLVGFVLIPFYTHYLTPADYGTLELIDVSVTLFGLAVMMWMNASVVRYYYEYDDAESRNEFISTVLLAATCIGIGASAFGFAFAKQISALILKSPAFYKYFWLVAATFGFSTLNSVSLSLLRARQRSGLVTAVSVGSMILSLSLNIYLIAVLKLGLVGILLSGLITTTASAIGLTALMLSDIPLRFSFTKLKALALFGAPLVITSFSSFALNFSDRFFLQHFSNVSAVGIYALGYKFGFMLSFLVVQPFDMIWSSRVYEIAKRPNGPELFSRIFRYYALVLVGAALGFSLVIKDAISIIASPAFHDAYKIVPVVALAYVFQGAYRFLVGGIYIEKKTHLIGTISAISLAVNLGLNYLLIRPYGGLGAAWATAVSFFLMAGMAYVVSERLYPVRYSVGAFFTLILTATALYLAGARIPLSSPFASIVLKIIVLASFPFALYLTGFLRKTEIEKLLRTAQSLWATYGWSAAASPQR